MEYLQKRALIVDGDTRTSNLVESVLLSLGIDCLKLQTSADAANALQQGRFLVAFLGCPVPFPESTDLTRQLRDRTYNRTTPIV
jgi:DNA-binding response OmpR family regulator